MKGWDKYLTLWLVIFPLLAIGQNPDNIKEWKVYKNENYELRYLNKWEVKFDPIFVDFTAYLRPDGLGIPLRENITMTTEEILDQPIFNLDSYLRITEESIQKHIFKAEILESKKVKKAGMEYIVLVYKGEKEGLRLKWKQWAWFINQKLFVLTYTAQESTFDQFLRTVEFLQSTIKFK